MPRSLPLLAGAALLLLAACARPSVPETWFDRALPMPAQWQVEAGATPARAQAAIRAAQRYAAFWNTGDAAFADQALAPDFSDLNLPEGRPQGRTGPVEASRAFRGAVPDLSARIESLHLVGDTAIVHLRFRGTFTGTFKGRQGQGQKVDFQAVDIYTVESGRIKTNWHLEDNLTLLLQLDALAFKS
jgi:predicted ester cyclase